MAPDDARFVELRRLLEIVDRLRAPDGCPWDRRQSLLSMAQHLLEEAYEAVEALQSGRREAVCEELGDLLMNIVLTARIAQDAGDFSMAEIAGGSVAKLVRRHPHVFGDQEAGDVEAVLKNWESIKSEERSQAEDQSALAGLPAALPALLLACRMGEKAARVGFEWQADRGALEKLDEEISELKEALARGDRDRISDELGDVLFSVVNVARQAGVEPESALRHAASRFSERFRYVERAMGKPLPQASLEEMEALWREAKRRQLEPAGFPAHGPEEWRQVARQLERVRDSLVASVRDLPEDLVQNAPHGGGWSIAEILEHLSRTERWLTLGLDSALRRGQHAPFPPEGLATHPPLHPLRFADRPVEAPQETLPEGVGGRAELLVALEASRAELLALLPRLVSLNPRGILLEHPLLGQLDALQWFEFDLLHERRHLKQVLDRIG